LFFYSFNTFVFTQLFVSLQPILYCNPFAKILKMAEIIVITVLIIAISLALLCIKLFVKKDGEFTSMHIHDSQAMKDRGIHCVLDQDKEARASGKAY
jgi:hypothetical protein